MRCRLQHTKTLCNTRCIATHCNTPLQHTATHHCNTLQHTATQCNTVQHTATHCNTPIGLIHDKIRHTLQIGGAALQKVYQAPRGRYHYLNLHTRPKNSSRIVYVCAALQKVYESPRGCYHYLKLHTRPQNCSRTVNMCAALQKYMKRPGFATTISTCTHAPKIRHEL